MRDGVRHPQLLSLEKRRQTLQDKLIALEEQLDLETRVEEKMRTEQLVSETRLSLQAVDQDFFMLKQQELMAEAGRLKRIGSPHEALAVWREIQLNNPDNTMAPAEITVLEKLTEQQDKAARLIKYLAARIRDIRPIFKHVVSALRQPADTAEYEVLLEQTELFLDDVLDVESYVMWWEAISETPKPQALQIIDMERIAGRVQRGEMVLFLGNGIASAYLGDHVDEGRLVSQLAKQIGYEHFNGSLSSIAEYYQLRPDFGQNELLKTVRSHLNGHGDQMILYSALAKVQSPLILISSVYDNRLEEAFQIAGKPYVELASIVQRSEDYDIGHVLVTYSDNHQPCKVYPEEDLSGMQFIEKGYSVIYKIRGNCSEMKPKVMEEELMQRDALTLAESSYFSFARYADRIIPGYLAKQLRNRGFLFVGYQARDWEDRLLAGALLEKRISQEPCYVLGEMDEPMEMAFWKSKQVEQYPMNIRDLDRCLVEVVS
ncbi:MAG: SIR2 family protein [Thiolinea sp.]